MAAAQVALLDRGATPRSSLVVLSRTVFDRALADAAVAAGARLVPDRARRCVPARLRAWWSAPDRRDYEADQILGADGANSIVRKKLAAPFTRAQLSVAAGFFVHGLSSSAIAIKSMRQQPGYLWSFPRRDHLAVGICAPAAHETTASELRAQTRSWIEQHGLHRATTLTPYAWPIPSVGFEDALADDVRRDRAGCCWEMRLGWSIR